MSVKLDIGHMRIIRGDCITGVVLLLNAEAQDLLGIAIGGAEHRADAAPADI